MLTQEICNKIKEELEFCQKPIFFFHDDPDGVTSFLQCYKYKQDGKGIIIKATPRIDAKFAKVVEEYGADKVFVLDIAMMDQEFIDNVKIPVIWIDHHAPQDRQKVIYINSRLWGENIPPSYVLNKVFNNSRWLSMIGCIGDWYLPDFREEFQKEYPEIMDKNYDHPEEIMFKTDVGKLVQIFSFNLKGTTKEAMDSVKTLTRIETPQEILNQETPRGKFIYKKYEKIKQSYEHLKTEALKNGRKEGKFFIYFYGDDKLSLTKDLSNELLFLMPDKVTILAREKDGVLRMSMRSGRDGPIINTTIEKAVARFPGMTGGGHEHACGVNIAKDRFEEFLAFLKEEWGE